MSNTEKELIKQKFKDDYEKSKKEMIQIISDIFDEIFEFSINKYHNLDDIAFHLIGCD